LSRRADPWRRYLERNSGKRRASWDHPFVQPFSARLNRAGNRPYSRGYLPRLRGRNAIAVRRRDPPTINSRRETELAATAAASLVGDDNVKRDLLPSIAAEDFACFLERKPGAYIWIGNGSEKSAAMLHNPHYDFNDAILPLGAIATR
jgi:metal-dependent amidase/aminoacylase/carboxypeptidase family protein